MQIELTNQQYKKYTSQNYVVQKLQNKTKTVVVILQESESHAWHTIHNMSPVSYVQVRESR